MINNQRRGAIRQIFTSLVIVAGLCWSPVANAGQIRVAVAANFLACAEELTGRFESATGYDVVLSGGSTGRHYAQIQAGAPFDIFLAADDERPRLLVDEGLAEADSRFVYALGKLALWVPDGSPELAADPETILRDRGLGHLAIANPRLAPYGEAARQALSRLNLWSEVQSRLVRGQSVGQAWQFAATGNAGCALVALAQVRRHGEGRWWEIDPALYDPIAQEAVLLSAATEPHQAWAFLEFLASTEARDLIEACGYGLPADPRVVH